MIVFAKGQDHDGIHLAGHWLLGGDGAGTDRGQVPRAGRPSAMGRLIVKGVEPMSVEFAFILGMFTGCVITGICAAAAAVSEWIWRIKE